MRTLPPFVHLRRTTHLAGESSFALVVLCVWGWEVEIAGVYIAKRVDYLTVIRNLKPI